MKTAKSKWLNYAIILALVISLMPLYAGAALGAATGIPATPQVSHDNWDNGGSFTISWNMWNGNNATSWSLLENNVELQGVGGPLTDNTPGAQSGSVRLQGKKLGQYTYVVKLTNSYGSTLSAPITVNVGKKGPLPSPAPVGPMPNKNIVVYFPEWGIYGAHNNYTMDKIPWDKVTHVNYAFAKPLADGTIAGFDCWAAMKESQGCENKDGAYDGNFADLQYAKAKYPRVKNLISIGGWTLSGTFSDIAADPVKRNRFAESSIEFMKKFGFDGIDIDWEYPGQPGDPNTNNKYRPEDKQNFNLLLAKVREKLDAASAADNRTGSDKYLLTIAAPAGETAISTSEPGVYHQYLDFINLMTYDYRGAWDRVTGHHSPVYPSEDGLEKEKFNADYTANLYHSLGVPKHKLNIGTPYYSRGWGLVDPNTGNNGMFANSGETYNTGPCGIWDDPNSQHNQCGGQNPYYHIKNVMEKDPAFTKYRDPVNQTPWLYSPSKREVYSYEDEVSLAFKADYVNNSGWGGMIVWEITGDSPAGGGTALTDVLYQKFTQPTVLDTEPPTAPTVVSTGVTQNSVSLAWSGATDNVGVTGYTVHYGPTGGSVTTVNVSGTSTTITGLSPNTSYAFRVTARDAAGNVSPMSNTVTVTTSAPDTEPPTAPTGLTVTGKTSTSVSLSWTASTDNVGVTGYEVYVNSASAPSATTTGATSVTVTGLAANTLYNFTVKARDAAGNRSEASSLVSVTTDPAGSTCTDPAWNATTAYSGGQRVSYNGKVYEARWWTQGDRPDQSGEWGPWKYISDCGGSPGDTSPPTAPAGLAVIGKTSTSVSLSWTASTDNVGVTGYEVYVNGASAPSATTSGASSVTVSGLSPNTTYSFTVKARDAAGNVSAASAAVSATTMAEDVPDTEPPTAPSGLTVTGKTSNSVNLSWTASTDNVSVTGYEVYVNGASAPSTTTTGATTATVSGLVPNTSYSFTVKARDASGNVSPASAAVSATTDPAPSTPEWKANTSYAAGDLVMYNYVKYKCLQPHTSLPGWEPSNVPALWQPQP